jgi:prophage antirepressor-like protein
MGAAKGSVGALAKHETTFEGQGLRFYAFRGRLCVIAADVGRVLGYADESLASVIRKQWAGEMVQGEDYDILRGDDLREFKAGADVPEGSSGSRARHLTILYESGLDLVLIKTDKPIGGRLRRFLVSEVLPKLRRGEPVLPSAPAPVPPAELPRAAAPAPTPALPAHVPEAVQAALDLLGPTLDARVRAALLDAAKPTIEGSLRLAADLVKALRVMPGVLPPCSPAERLAMAEERLALVDQALAEGDPSPSLEVDIAHGIANVRAHLQAAAPLPDDPALRRRYDAACERLRSAATRLQVRLDGGRRDEPQALVTPRAGRPRGRRTAPARRLGTRPALPRG